MLDVVLKLDVLPCGRDSMRVTVYDVHGTALTSIRAANGGYPRNALAGGGGIDCERLGVASTAELPCADDEAFGKCAGAVTRGDNGPAHIVGNAVRSRSREGIARERSSSEIDERLAAKHDDNGRIGENLIGLRGISERAGMPVLVREGNGGKRLREKLIEFALAKNESRGVHAVVIVEQNRNGDELGYGHKADKQNHGSQQHFENAEAGLTVARSDLHNGPEATAQEPAAQVICRMPLSRF